MTVCVKMKYMKLFDLPSSSVMTVMASVNTPQPMTLQTATPKSYEVKGRMLSVTL